MFIHLESQLGSKKFFGGEKLNIGDFYVHAWMHSNDFISIDGNNDDTEEIELFSKCLKVFPKLDKYTNDTMMTEMSAYMHILAPQKQEEAPDMLKAENDDLKNEIRGLKKRLDSYNRRHPEEQAID